MPISSVTSFPLTYNENVTDSDHRNLAVRIAHDIILNEKVSPYQAWIYAASQQGTIFDLPGILGMSQRDCNSLIFDPRKSPPADKVLRFCRTLGIHPADLEPGLADENHSYSRHVLHAMTWLMKDPETLSHDRERCMKAFMAEKQRLAKFIQEKPRLIDLMMSAMGEMNRGRAVNLKDSKGLAFDFHYALGFHRTSLEDGLDCLDEQAKSRLRAGAIAEDRAAQTYISLVEIASTFYGAASAAACVDKIVETCEDMQSQKKGKARKYIDYGELEKVVAIGGDDIASLVEKGGELGGMNFLDLYKEKERFIYLLDTYISIDRKKCQPFKAGETQDREILEISNGWKDDPRARDADLEKFGSLLLIYPYLQQGPVQLNAPVNYNSFTL